MRSLATWLVVLALTSCKHTAGPSGDDTFRGEAEGRAALVRDLGQVPSMETPAQIAARYADACAHGWHPACNPAWIGEGRARLDAAALALSAPCEAGDPLACDVVAWSLVQSEPGVVSATAPGLGDGIDLLRKTCGTPGPGMHPGAIQACLDLGEMQDRGIGVAKNPPAALAALQGACESGDTRACAVQAARTAIGDGIPKDPVTAATTLRDLCGGGEPLACSELGVLTSSGSGVTVDPAAAALLQQQACDAGEPVACTRLGRALVHGEGTSRDPSQAVAMFGKACAGNEPSACLELSGAKLRGEGGTADKRAALDASLKACSLGALEGCGQGVTPYDVSGLRSALYRCDESEIEGCRIAGKALSDARRPAHEREIGVDMLEKACNDGDPEGCAVLASRYEEGLSVGRDGRLAAELYGKSCGAGLMSSCVHQGDIIARGAGPERDPVLAAGAFAKACNSGDFAACRLEAEQELLASQEGRMSDGATKGRTLLERTCDAGDSASCLRLSDIWRDGIAVRADQKKATNYIGRACAAKDAASCFDLADASVGAMGKPIDVAPAAAPLVQGLRAVCNTSTDAATKDRACYSLSRVLEKGKGVPHEAEGSAAAAQVGCDAKGPKSCAQFGKLLAAGVGVPKDVERAAALLEGACAQQISEACDERAKLPAVPHNGPIDTPNGPTTVEDQRQDEVIYK